LKNYQLGLYKLAFGCLLSVMFVLPYFSVEDYVIWRNTTSHLGAQGAPYAWLMNGSFILMAVATAQLAFTRMRSYGFQQVCIAVFSIGLVGTALFRHAPIVEGLVFSVFEDHMHSVFASLVGFSFTLFAVSTAFIVRNRTHRIVSISVATSSVILSILIFSTPEFAGVWQRIMFIVSFAWLLWLFEKVELA